MPHGSVPANRLKTMHVVHFDMEAMPVHLVKRGYCSERETATVLLPTLTTWGQPVSKARIQLQREVFSTRVLSLVMSFEGIMVLNSEL